MLGVWIKDIKALSKESLPKNIRAKSAIVSEAVDMSGRLYQKIGILIMYSDNTKPSGSNKIQIFLVRTAMEDLKYDINSVAELKEW